jgi:bifunctional DNA-binding transcriptional regulator/antitoxin component of YhaV-PrlF toxin-antitoxin module
MRLNSKGHVTIPAESRRRHHVHEDDEVEVIDATRGRRMVAAMRGKATTAMTTDELMELLRGE